MDFLKSALLFVHHGSLLGFVNTFEFVQLSDSMTNETVLMLEFGVHGR